VGGIIFAAKEFAGTTAFQGGPKKEWAEGVGGAIGAFSPLYGILVKGGIMKALGVGGVGIEEFNNAIKTITQGIIFSAGLFNKNSAAFDLERTPKKEWAERVGAAIQAFMPALDFVSKNTGIFAGDGSANLTKGLNATTNGIVYAAVTLGIADYSKVIPESWTKGLVTAVKGYLDLVMSEVYPKQKWLKDALKKFNWVVDSISRTSQRFKEISSNVSNFDSQWIGGLDKVVRTYVGLAEMAYVKKWLFDSFTEQGAITKLGWLTWSIKGTAERFSYISKITSNIKPDWMANVDQNVRMYVDLADYLSSTDTDYSKVSTAVSNLEKISKGYSELAKGVSKLSAELEKIDMEKLTALRSLTGSIILMSLMDSDQFKEMMDALEDKAKIFVDVINELESKTEKTKPGKEAKPGIGVKSGGGGEVKRPEKTMSDLFSVMEAIDLKMGELVSSNDNLSKYVDEIRSDDLNLKKKK
jgi:hypothetical protein